MSAAGEATAEPRPEGPGAARLRRGRHAISRIPMGQEIAVTPLQMVMAMCAVANNGRLMRPMLVDSGSTVRQEQVRAITIVPK